MFTMEPMSDQVPLRQLPDNPIPYSRDPKSSEYTVVSSTEHFDRNDDIHDPWLQHAPSPGPPQPTLNNQGPIPTKPSVRNTITAWALELFAVFVSIAALVAIVIILYRENDRPLTEWNLKVSLNTIISTLGTISRTTLAFALSACIGQQKWNWLGKRPAHLAVFETFDGASRGPWGATRLFIWLKFRHWAALGAIVVIGTIAFDPFLQAVISTYGSLDSIPSSNGNNIGYTSKIDGGQVIDVRAGPIQFWQTEAGELSSVGSRTLPDFGIISAAYNGFYNTEKTQNQAVTFQCSTGNCTWPNFVSTAVCSTCNDISSSLKRSSAVGKDGSSIPFQSNIWPNATYTRFQLPHSDLRNYNGYSGFDGQNWYGQRQVQTPNTAMTANLTYDPYETITFQKYETLLMAFSMIRAADDYIKNKTKWENTTPVATECALYLCVKEFKSLSKNSVLHEEVVNSWATRDPNSYKFNNGSERWDTGPNSPAWIEMQGNRLYDAWIDPPRYDLRLTIPATATGFEKVSDLNVTHRFIGSTIQFLLDFTGVSDLKANTTLGFPDARGAPFMGTLWSSDNFTATFDNVARSLTNQLRNVAQQRRPGTVQSWVIHIKVNWAYLAYSIALLSIGIIYVVLTIIESTNIGLPVWKDRLLPILLYGFDNETQRYLRSVEHDRGKSSHSAIVSKDKPLVTFGYDESDNCTRLAVR